MRRSSLFLGALLGGLTSLPVIALRIWPAMGRPAFYPLRPVRLAGARPTGRIDYSGYRYYGAYHYPVGHRPISSAAKRMEQLQGILLVVGGGVAFGAIIALALRLRNWAGRTVGLAAGLLVFMLTTAMEISLGGPAMDNPLKALLWLAILIAGWGTLLGTWLSAQEASDATPAMTEEFRAARRAFLLEVRRRLHRAGPGCVGLDSPAGGPAGGDGGRAGPPGSAVASRCSYASGCCRNSHAGATSSGSYARSGAARPRHASELTSNANFYRIDIDTLPPVVEKSSWVLA